MVNNGTIKQNGSDDYVSVSGTGGDDTVTNGKLITGGLRLGDGANVITNNSGGMIGETAALNTYDAILTGIGIDKLTNSGTITGHIDLGDGNNVVINSGTMKSSALVTILDTGSGNDTLTNSGTIGAGVSLGGGNDTLNNFVTIGTTTTHGTIAGTIDLGAGNDTLKGGKNVETVRDGDGVDDIDLGAGNDVYIAIGATSAINDGDETIKGGANIDTYDASAGSSSMVINIDSIAHDESIGYGTASLARTATGVFNSGIDTIFDFENAFGGSGSDLIYGSGAVNDLRGMGGFDDLWGYAGNDTIDGGAGEDWILGGAGRDILTGGSEADRFWYLDATDSTVLATGRDKILDFDGAIDRIELTGVDSNTTLASNQSDFEFIGTNVNFSGVAGELRAYWTATGQVVEGNTDADVEAEFAIEFYDPTHSIVFTDAMFIG